jgi:two-component system nitrate/nitrite sensor histidine kinase NarX
MGHHHRAERSSGFLRAGRLGRSAALTSGTGGRKLATPESTTGHPASRLVKILRGRKLFTKITGVLAAVFVLSLVVIGLTLHSSWRLEGVAAAINDAGSLRMRSWSIAYQLARLPVSGEERTRRVSALRDEFASMEAVQAGLERGDPSRPLFVPQDSSLPDDVVHLGELWRSRLKPVAGQILAGDEGSAALRTYEADTASFVASINDVMDKMEVSYARSTSALRGFQVLLAVLAVLATTVLMLFFFVAVIRPVQELQEGMRRVAQEDFAVRVPVLSADEFSDLSRGFNRMAEHLQDLYRTLEERVESKTQRLAEINRDLRILYDISRFLREPVSIEELSQGFIERVKATFGSDAASVRLFDAGTGNLFLATQEGMDEGFIAREAVQRCGDCLCGQAMLGDIPVISDTASLGDGATRDSCSRAGYVTVTAIPVNHKQCTVGLFNLFFKKPTRLSEGDLNVLQSLGQHLGMAIENVRLRSREREMAVSEERNLIARELHDSIAQGLAFLNLQVQMLNQALAEGKQEDVRTAVDMIHRGVQEGYADVRELLQHFRARFDQPDLESALHTVLDKFTEQSGVPAELKTHGMGAPFGTEVQTQVLYIVQEALSNVRKHAQADQVRIDLWRDRQGLRIAIADDGIGFDGAKDDGGGTGEHIGLHIMGERAARIGATLDIRSRPGEGTRVCLSLPRAEVQKETA